MVLQAWKFEATKYFGLACVIQLCMWETKRLGQAEKHLQYLVLQKYFQPS